MALIVTRANDWQKQSEPAREGHPPIANGPQRRRHAPPPPDNQTAASTVNQTVGAGGPQGHPPAPSPAQIHPVTPCHPSVKRRSTHGGVASYIAEGTPGPRISCLRSSFTNRGNSVRAIG